MPKALLVTTENFYQFLRFSWHDYTGITQKLINFHAAIVPIMGYYYSMKSNKDKTTSSHRLLQPLGSQGMRLLRALQLEGKYIFTMDEAARIADAQNIPLLQLKKILSNLTIKGWLSRLRRGLYATGTSLLPGQIQPHPFAIATHLIQPSAISHWSALQHHGLTEQIPQIITASTTQKVVTPSMRQEKAKSIKKKHEWEIAGLRYEYITIQKKHFFGIEKVWVDEYFQVDITDKERTLLDMLIYSKMFGGMGEVLGVLENALSDLNISKLVQYAIQYDKNVYIKRLGWALEHFGVPSKQLTALKNISINYYYPLDPSKPKVGEYDKCWMIQNNLAKK